MKSVDLNILYAFLDVGKGHAHRVRSCCPEFQNYGDVTLLASGGKTTSLGEGLEIHERLRGLTLKYGKNKVNWLWTIIRNGCFLPKTGLDILTRALWMNGRFNVLINDHEPVTSWAARLVNAGAMIDPRHFKRIVTWSFSHHVSFLSRKVPRPKYSSKSLEVFLASFAPCQRKRGIHFDNYEPWIKTPLISEELRKKKRERPVRNKHCTVYLPGVSIDNLISRLGSIKQTSWEIFHPHCKETVVDGNVTVLKTDQINYAESLASADCMITSGGMGGPADALYLGIPALIFPQGGQAEQLYNAAAAELLGHQVFWQGGFPKESTSVISKFVNKAENRIPIEYPDHIRETVQGMIAETESILVV